MRADASGRARVDAETRRVSGPSSGARAHPDALPALRRRAAPRRGQPRLHPPRDPTSTIAAPPTPTKGKHHSAATGGGASAFATATPNCSTACSSARPQTTRRLGKSLATDSRKSHLRRVASSRTTSRSGRAAASGTPGAPPPEPTSITAPSYFRTNGTTARLSVEVHPPCLGSIPDRRQAGRLEQPPEPALEPLVNGTGDRRRNRGQVCQTCPSLCSSTGPVPLCAHQSASTTTYR